MNKSNRIFVLVDWVLSIVFAFVFYTGFLTIFYIISGNLNLWDFFVGFFLTVSLYLIHILDSIVKAKHEAQEQIKKKKGGKK